MPSEGSVDWYWLTLVAGAAVVAFGLGSASTVWWLNSAVRDAALAQNSATLANSGPMPIRDHGTGLGTSKRPPTATAETAGLGRLGTPAVQSSAPSSPAWPDTAPGPTPFAAAAAKPEQAGVAASSGTGLAVSSPAAPSGGQSTNPPQEAGTAAAAAAQGGLFSLQVGAFLDAANAKLLSGRLTSEGYAPMSIEAADGYGHVWHYVRLGVFADEQAASLIASEILERTGIASVIVRGSATSAGG